MLRLCLFIFFFSFFLCDYSQKLKPQTLDSLLKISESNKKDTGVVTALNRLSVHYRFISEFSKSLVYAKRANEYAKPLNFKNGIGFSYNNIGIAYKYMGDYSKALDSYGFALKVYEKMKNDSGVYLEKKGLSATLINIGNVYSYWGNNSQALDVFFRALTMREELKDSSGISALYNNIGSSYDHLKDFDKALDYHFKALDLRKKMHDSIFIAASIQNIGNCYYHQKKYEKAVAFYLESLVLRKGLNDLAGTALTLNNLASSSATIADIAREEGNDIKAKEHHLKAIDYAEQALSICREVNDKSGIGSAILTLGATNLSLKNYATAEKYLNEALELFKGTGYKERIMETYLALSDLKNNTGKGTEAYTYYKKYIVYRDSITNEENTKNSIRAEMKFDFDKKQTEQALEQKRKDEVSEHELAQQKIITYATVGGAILVLILLGVAYRGYREKKKANTEIILQKEIIEEKAHEIAERQKEILDSINYAQRLQLAILSTPEEIKKYFPDSFVLYKPKDIVAGDFYFFEVYKSTVFFAAADCTGHGVPGALVSIVCANALSRAIKEFNLVAPGQILDKTRDLVVETFKKSGKDVKDGMDISFLTIENFNEKLPAKISWAGANNPLWFFSEGKMNEIKADKQPVGLYDHFKNFNTVQIEPKTKQSFYLFTDGFADQFGGPKGKKFKYRQLNDLLVSSAEKSMQTQSEILATTFESWKGSLEQIDDVCVIGFRS
ncbi:MAG: tetratricopeptide repeat protein [Bacteroidia bacterium]|nr:tetratricopeptide repeat protein [Bacteroidia bacterium]